MSTGLGTAISGLRAAQAGLAVTGHNMSNAEIKGYSRQRIIQKDSFYTSIGSSQNGTSLMRGLGTDWNAISQIRNEFLDYSYRQSNSKLAFYTVKTTCGVEIESLLGEIQGAYSYQSVIQDMWYAIEELTAHPQGVETRDNFLATSQSFVTKSNEVYNSLLEYQHNLDQQVRGAVNDVNDTVTRIDELNSQIAIAEASGDNPNDYRDERNLMLDRLSELLPINYSYDLKGNAIIFTEGHTLLINGDQNFMGLRYTSDDYSFVEPVFTGVKKDDVLRSDVPPTEFEAFMNYNKPINADRGNDYGVLKGLLVARGAMPAYYPGEDGLVEPQPPTKQPVLITGNAPTAADFPGYTGQDLINAMAAAQAALDEYNSAPKFSNPPTEQEKDDYIAYMQDAAAKGKQIYMTAADRGVIQPLQSNMVREYNADKYNFEMQTWSIRYGMIPKSMMKLDQIFNSVVTMINDTLAPAMQDPNDPTNYIKDPNAPFDNEKNRSYYEVFTRSSANGIYLDRWDGDNLNPEVDGQYSTQYSIGNVVLNPELLSDEGGFNLLAFSLSGDIENTQLLNNLQTMWQSNDPAVNPYAVEVDGIYFNMNDAYTKYVAEMSTEISEANSYVNSQEVQVEQADSKRQSVMGVSMDEEMSTMMKYQYAFQAAARIVNVIDSMIDKVVNGTGRVGL